MSPILSTSQVKAFLPRALNSVQLWQRCFLFNFALTILVSVASPALAQIPQKSSPGMEVEHEDEMRSKAKSLSEQIMDLKHQASELEAKLREQGVNTAAMKAAGDERRLNSSMGTVSGLPQVTSQQSMATTGSSQMQGMNMMSGMMSMMSSMMSGMGAMPGGSAMGPPGGIAGGALLSSLPGFPGASHLYHIGSTNFFLDHPDHITLSLDQQSRLSKLRMSALMRRSEFNRKIQAGEEQLWLLTAADQPDYSLIENKIREIEKHRSDLRLTFIKDVGVAASLLSDAQRMALLGQTSLSGGNIIPPTRNSQNSGAMGEM